MKKINILSILSILVSLLFNILLFKLNILPTKYLMIIYIILIIINIIGITLINLSRKVFKIIGIITLLIYMCVAVIGTYYLYSTNNFLNKSFKNETNNTTTNTYYIVTYKDSEYNNKKDIKDSIYYYESSINIDSAVKKLKQEIKVQYDPYTSLSTLIKDLDDHKINFILLDKSSYDLVFNLDENLDKNNFKIIYKFDIKTKKSTTNTNNSSKIKDSFNIYIGGSDFDNLMDFNMIVTINMKTHKVLLTSIPRDYYIEEYNTGGKKDTLSFMGANGIQTNLKSIENFFDIDIDYYININTKSLVGIVDAVGGITYCSEFSFTTTHALVLDTYDDTKGKKLYVKKGCQRLNGIQTLTVARERKAFPGSDRLRQKHCQKIMIAIFNELKNINTITNYNNILNSLSNLYVTDIPKEEITYIIKDTINGTQWEILEQSVDGSDGYDYVHLTDLKSYVMYPNMDTVNTAKQQINNILK